MDNLDLLQQVIAFKNKFYRYSWNHLDECVQVQYALSRLF